jgi:hypothetical protein
MFLHLPDIFIYLAFRNPIITPPLPPVGVICWCADPHTNILGLHASMHELNAYLYIDIHLAPGLSHRTQPRVLWDSPRLEAFETHTRGWDQEPFSAPKDCTVLRLGGVPPGHETA